MAEVTPIQNAPSNTAAKATVAPGRGRKPGTESKERAPIPAEEFQLTQLSGKTLADRRRKREPRTPQQKQVDNIIYSIFQSNVESGFANGTIADWADLEVFDWAVSAGANAENALFMVQKGCRLYNRKLILGEQLEIEAGAKHTIPDPENDENEIPCHLNGKKHVHIPFSVVRRPRRAPKVV